MTGRKARSLYRPGENKVAEKEQQEQEPGLTGLAALNIGGVIYLSAGLMLRIGDAAVLFSKCMNSLNRAFMLRRKRECGTASLS